MRLKSTLRYKVKTNFGITQENFKKLRLGLWHTKRSLRFSSIICKLAMQTLAKFFYRR
jgi:hypothetical protein